MRAAIWVLSGFAGLWGIAAVIGLGWPIWLAAMPVVISTLLMASAARLGFPDDERALDDRRRIGRLIGIWSGVEVLAIVLVTNLLGHFHLTRAATPAVVIIVGLHLIPLARGIPFRGYYWSAIGLIAVGAVALFFAPPLNIGVATIGAAIVLWGTSIVLLSKKTARRHG